MGVFYQREREQLRRHLSRFYKVLKKSTMLPEEEKERMAKELDMQYGHDWFLETLPEVIDMRAESEAKGELKDARKMLIRAVKARFKTLEKAAKERAANSDSPDELQDLVLAVFEATDEAVVLHLLQTYSKQPEGKRSKGKQAKGKQRSQAN